MDRIDILFIGVILCFGGLGFLAYHVSDITKDILDIIRIEHDINNVNFKNFADKHNNLVNKVLEIKDKINPSSTGDLKR